MTGVCLSVQQACFTTAASKLGYLAVLSMVLLQMLARRLCGWVDVGVCVANCRAGGQSCGAERFFFFFFCMCRGGSDEDMTSGLTRAHAFGPGNLCRPKRPSGGVGQ